MIRRKFVLDYNRRIVAASDEFYSYTKPTDFRLETREVQVFSTREVPDQKLEAKVKGTFGEFLRFTSPVKTPYPEDNLRNAKRWFPAKGRRAVVLLPHWNADAVSYVALALCKLLNMLGIAVLRLTMPYHDIRMPAEISRADYAVSANIGRTLDAVRQGVVDIRSCLDWLEQQGYSDLGIAGKTSLGSCCCGISRRRTTRGFGWPRSIMRRRMSPTWCGMGSRPVISGKELSSRLILIACGMHGWR